jgi:quinol monooxygenase YgiN
MRAVVGRSKLVEAVLEKQGCLFYILVEEQQLEEVVESKLVEVGEDMKVFVEVHLALVLCTTYKTEE